jgi:hypothetical protein
MNEHEKIIEKDAYTLKSGDNDHNFIIVKTEYVIK